MIYTFSRAGERERDVDGFIDHYPSLLVYANRKTSGFYLFLFCKNTQSNSHHHYSTQQGWKRITHLFLHLTSYISYTILLFSFLDTIYSPTLMFYSAFLYICTKFIIRYCVFDFITKHVYSLVLRWLSCMRVK